MFISSRFFVIVVVTYVALVFSLEEATPAGPVDEIKTNIVKVKQLQSEPQSQQLRESNKLRGSREEGGKRSNSNADPNMGHQRTERTNSKIDPSARQGLPSVRKPEPAGEMDMLALQKQMRTTQKRTEMENKKSFNSESAKQQKSGVGASVSKDSVIETAAPMPKKPSSRRSMKEQLQNNGKNADEKNLKGDKVLRRMGDISSGDNDHIATGWVGLQAMTAFFVIIAAVGFALFIRPMTNSRSGYQPL